MSLTITTARENRYVDVNETFLEKTGWKREEVIGRTASDLGLWVDPEERVALVNRLLGGDVIRNVEFRARMRNGEVRTNSRSAELIEIDGELCVLSVTADITHLKRAEETLRESEERFRLVANTAPVMIWMAGVDKLRNYFNLTWLEFTGRSLDEELGMGWAEGMHPDDYPHYMNSYTKAFERRQPFRFEYRLRRRDGEYRWVLASGVPRFHADGSFAGYIGSGVDVTDRKLAEEAISMVSRRLIEAHEEERTWLARELHDDIGQQICLLLMSLGRLTSDMQASIAEIREGVAKAIEQASSIVVDMRALSHRLHSSKLQYLGLVAAAEGHCNELAHQHQVKVELRTENIPRDLSQEISLCIFRVLQEALQNAIKHSRAYRFDVLLSRRAEEISLTVRDFGIGFDPVVAMKSRGLGLTSMKERLKLVDGELWIESESGVGTAVHVRVPLRVKAAVAL
jgi:PAS domain S-box-containing protein